MNKEGSTTGKNMNTEEDVTTKKNESTKESPCGCAEENTCGCAEEGTLVEGSDVINDIMTIFEDPDCAYPLDDVIDELRALGHENPGKILTLALQDDVIYVDSVEDDGMVYLALIEQDEGE